MSNSQVAVGVLAVALTGFAFASGWAIKGWQSGQTIADLLAERERGRTGRAEAVLAEEAQIAQLESQHASDTIYNADQLQSKKTDIAADMFAELEHARRLQLSAERRAATYRAQAQADATARSHLANHTATLDRQLAEGIGVVAELGGALKQRDAEVAALCAQVNIERRLNGDTSAQACSQK